MQRLLLLIGGPLLCVVLTIGLLLTGKSAITGQENAAVPEMTLETPDIGDVPDIGEDQSAVPSGPAVNEDATSARTDDDIVPPVPPATVPEPPPVTSAPLDAPAPSTGDTLEETILRHPVALSASLVQFEDRLIQIEGVRPQSAERTCPATTGTWPCGTVARTAFRNFIRSRAFTCRTPQGGWRGTITARCTIGKDDPALWLARNGWAETDRTDGDLQAGIEAAKRTSKGFYRSQSVTFPSPASGTTTMSGPQDPAATP